MEIKEQKKDNKKEEVIPPPKMILFKDKIIKVLEESSFFYVGFDILSETLYRIKKNNNAIELPEAVITLLRCEKSRLRLADSMTDTRGSVSKLLGMSERNLYRCYKMYNMFPDDLIGEGGKIISKQKLVNMPVKKIKVKMLNSKPKQKLITDGKKRKK